MIRTPCIVVGLALGASLLPAALAGQQVVGRAVEDTGAPVFGVVLTLVSADSAVRVSTESDSAGRFRLAAPRAGLYTLTATRLAYGSPAPAALQVDADAVVEVVVRLTAYRGTEIINPLAALLELPPPVPTVNDHEIS